MKSDVKFVSGAVLGRQEGSGCATDQLADQVRIIIDLAQELGLLIDGEPRPPLLRVPEVAEILGVSPKTVYELLANGEIPGLRRVGRCVRVARDPLLQWIREGA